MRATIPVLMLALGGCAPPSPVAMQSSLPQMLAGLSAGAPRSCLPSRTSSGLQLIDDNTAIVRDGGTLWVNHLPAPCNAGNGLKTVVIDVHGGEYCRNDHFTLVDSTSTIPGPACFLGDWVPYTRS